MHRTSSRAAAPTDKLWSAPRQTAISDPLRRRPASHIYLTRIAPHRFIIYDSGPLAYVAPPQPRACFTDLASICRPSVMSALASLRAPPELRPRLETPIELQSVGTTQGDPSRPASRSSTASLPVLQAGSSTEPPADADAAPVMTIPESSNA